jgi:hypothetical protein
MMLIGRKLEKIDIYNTSHTCAYSLYTKPSLEGSVPFYTWFSPYSGLSFFTFFCPFSSSSNSDCLYTSGDVKGLIPYNPGACMAVDTLVYIHIDKM